MHLIHLSCVCVQQSTAEYTSGVYSWWMPPVYDQTHLDTFVDTFWTMYLLHWLLAGCCGLALLNLAVADYVAGNKTLRITQKPRFYGVITNRTVGIVCLSSKQHLQSTVQWFKASKYDSDKIPIHPGGSIFLRNRNLTENAILLLTDLSIEDQGVYFCKINNVSGPGTEVQVASEYCMLWSRCIQPSTPELHKQ